MMMMKMMMMMMSFLVFLHHLVSVNSFMFHHAIMKQYRTGVNNSEVLIGIPRMLDGVIASMPLIHS